MGAYPYATLMSQPGSDLTMVDGSVLAIEVEGADAGTGGMEGTETAGTETEAEGTETAGTETEGTEAGASEDGTVEDGLTTDGEEAVDDVEAGVEAGAEDLEAASDDVLGSFGLARAPGDVTVGGSLVVEADQVSSHQRCGFIRLKPF